MDTLNNDVDLAMVYYLATLETINICDSADGDGGRLVVIKMM